MRPDSKHHDRIRATCTGRACRQLLRYLRPRPSQRTRDGNILDRTILR